MLSLLLFSLSVWAKSPACPDPQALLAHAATVSSDPVRLQADIESIHLSLSCHGQATSEQLAAFWTLKGALAVQKKDISAVQEWFTAAQQFNQTIDPALFDTEIVRAWDWVKGRQSAEPSPLFIPPLSQDAREQAEPLTEGITLEQHRWLNPTRGRLKPDPTQDNSFSAYTLEWGEAAIGLNTISVGVLPRVEVGFHPLALALNAPNLKAKVNPLQIGPVSGSLSASYIHFSQTDFTSRYAQLGAQLSVEVHPNLSIHLGSTRGQISASGVPLAGSFLQTLAGSTLELPSELIGDTPPSLSSKSWSTDLSIDARINQRDSFILQVKSTLWGKVDSNFGLAVPPIFGLKEAFKRDGWLNPRQTTRVSIAYQARFNHLLLRVGLGYSPTPYAWALDTFELRYQFGGPSRRADGNRKLYWEAEEKNVINGSSDSLSPSEVF